MATKVIIKGDTADQKLQHKRKIENARESQVLLWIWHTLQGISEFDYDQYLRDGVILCKLMNLIKPGSITDEIIPGTDIKQKRKNVENFIRACADYGVKKELLFHYEDLLLMQNIPKVTRCLFELGKLAAKDNDFKGAQLGDEPYEPVDPKSRRRGGLPLGDDIYIAHVSLAKIKKMIYG